MLVNGLWPYIAASTSVLSCGQDVLGKCIFVVCGDVIVSLKGVVCDSLLTADHESARDGWELEGDGSVERVNQETE